MTAMQPTQLGDLLRGIDGVSVRIEAQPARTGEFSAISVAGLTEDSRTVGAGFIFVARVGAQFDGRKFIGDAIAGGAIAIIVEKTAECLTVPANATGAPLPVIAVASLSAVLGIIAERFYGKPTTGPHNLKLIGITGTNGKTTTAHLIHGMLNDAGKKCGLIGTVSTDDGGPAGLVDSALTTPMAIDLSATLARMVAHDCEYAVMEVSSHALAQGRVNGLQLAGAVFTNLSGDHLDYHGTMTRYAEAKAALFNLVKPGGWAVINLDDEAGPSMAEAASRVGLEIIGIGRASNDQEEKKASTSGQGSPPAWEVAVQEVTLSGMKLTLNSIAGMREVQTRLVGDHNALNLAQACAVVHCCGVGITRICADLATNCLAPPGRLEPVFLPDGTDLGFTVLVDYAHTDDALRNVLRAVRPMVQMEIHETRNGRLIVIFGCGGDRDQTKRPRMLQAALATSDLVMVTSDNPRTESADEIIRDILNGINHENRAALEQSGQLLVEVDRARAIAQVLSSSVARPGDVVVIAGKGHEDYQIIGRVKHDFDDRIIARNILTQRKNLEIFWTLEELAASVGGQLIGRGGDDPSSSRLSGGVSIDSRSVNQDDIFIAIKGERFDGHDFVSDVQKDGKAALIIVSASWWAITQSKISIDAASPPILIVNDTIEALGKLAAAYRQRCLSKVKLIAITGSCGKTTTKTMIDAVLRQTLTGSASVKSFNNNIGVPLTILQASPYADYLIIEIGTNAPGEIRTLGKITRADIGIITNVGRSHLAGLGSIAGVAKEKTALFATLTESPNWSIWPADGFDLTSLINEDLTGISFGERAGATIQLINYSMNETSSAMNFALNDGSNWSIPALGKHQILNAIVALIVGRQMGLPDDVIQSGLDEFKMPPLRFERTLIPDRGIVVFNDAYNANPESMRASIQTFIQLVKSPHQPSGKGRRILVLGEMLELGEATKACHQEVVQYVESLLAAGTLDRAFLIGAGFAGLANVAQMSGVEESNLSQLARIADEMAEGDRILIKGSRAVGLERLLTILTEGELSTA